jgi:hypothetical protein
MIACASAAVDGPVFAAHSVIRCGVHCACARWASGMCSGSVEYPLRLNERGWEATRCPRRNTSTVAADSRTSSSWRASR